MDTVKFRYSSPANISFHGVLDTGIHPDDWTEMSPRDQQEALWDAVSNRLIWIEDQEMVD